MCCDSRVFAHQQETFTAFGTRPVGFVANATECPRAVSNMIYT